MGTMNVSLPDSLKEFVDEQVERRGYGTSSEYIRELIRRDHDRVWRVLHGQRDIPESMHDSWDGAPEQVSVPGDLSFCSASSRVEDSIS
jgi:antitoxin ParD1/3/4